MKRSEIKEMQSYYKQLGWQIYAFYQQYKILHGYDYTSTATIKLQRDEA